LKHSDEPPKANRQRSDARHTSWGDHGSIITVTINLMLVEEHAINQAGKDKNVGAE
jgi:hypothetical protein